MKTTDFLIFDLTGLNPCLDLVSIPLQLLDFLLQVRLKLFLLVYIICIIYLKHQKSRKPGFFLCPVKNFTASKTNILLTFHCINNKRSSVLRKNSTGKFTHKTNKKKRLKGTKISRADKNKIHPPVPKGCSKSRHSQFQSVY